MQTCHGVPYVGRVDRSARTGACLVAVLLASGALAAPAEAAGPAVVGGHRPVVAGEHPRLIVRGHGGAQVLRAKAAGPWGQKVDTRLRQAVKLTEKLAVTGRNREVITEAGFKAAGYGAVHLLDADPAAAGRARAIILREIIGYPMGGSLDVMDRASRLHGTALAYDLCHGGWDDVTRRKVRTFLLAEARALAEKVGATDPALAEQPGQIVAWSAVGLAEMAVLADSEDPDARRRIATCERAVTDYLNGSIGGGGFDAHGESVRQAAFASGILPFVHAERIVLGRDFTAHPAIASVLLPMIHQCVPNVGMAFTGKKTATIDRTGLFALAADLTPAAQRPAVAWLFREIGGEKYLGIVRPHHGLHMLTSCLETVAPALPGGDWPRLLRSDRAKYALFRSRWQDANDVLVVVYDRGIRILGMGTHWVSHAGRHAALYSHDAKGAGSFDNVFTIQPRLGGQTVYRVGLTSRLTAFGADAEAGCGSVAFAVRGDVQRLLPKEETDQHAKVVSDLSVPEGGAFEAVRVFGADYTGRSGAVGLFVVADRLAGAGGAGRVWVLHVGPDVKLTTDATGFTLTGPDATLRGTILHPHAPTIRCTARGPLANFLSVNTNSERFEVIMTLQRGQPPEVAATGRGLSAGVTVGKRAVRLNGQEIAFTD